MIFVLLDLALSNSHLLEIHHDILGRFFTGRKTFQMVHPLGHFVLHLFRRNLFFSIADEAEFTPDRITYLLIFFVNYLIEVHMLSCLLLNIGSELYFLSLSLFQSFDLYQFMSGEVSHINLFRHIHLTFIK